MKCIKLVFLALVFISTTSFGKVPKIGDIDIRPRECKLTIKKSVKPKELKFGETARYYFTVKNIGKYSCRRLRFRDTLPQGMSYNGNVITSSSCNNLTTNGQTVQCNIGYIPPHASLNFSFKVNVPEESNAGGQGWSKDHSHVKNCATVSSRYIFMPNAFKSKKIRPPYYIASDCVNAQVVTPKPKFCKADTMIVLDYSGSMTHPTSNNGTYMSVSKTAAKTFASRALSYTGNQVGIGSFSTTATLNTPLTTNQSMVNSAINGLFPFEMTNISAGFTVGFNELINNSALQNRILVLLSDGGNSVGTFTPQSIISTAINNNILVYTIGFGDSADNNLKPVATGTGGLYFNPGPTQQQLNQVYSNISSDACQATIAGIKFNDKNGNGVKDAGESPVKGVTINLINASGAIVSSTTTANDGSYRFSNVTPGSYEVKEIVPSGWTQTFPVSGVHSVTIAESQHINHLNFGNRHQVDMHISGMKFHDINNNHHKDAGEPPLLGVIIKLYSADSNGNPIGLIATTTTNSSGNYSFTGLSAGNYLVKEVVGSLGTGWTQTYPLTKYGAHLVALKQGSSKEGLDFGNANCKDTCNATLYGFKYYDKNKNGKYDKGEEKLTNWRIELIHADGSSTFATTDSNGEYSITIPNKTLDETVDLIEWMLPGWQAVSPSGGVYSNIDLSPGYHLNYSFGNAKICDKSRKYTYTDLSIYVSRTSKRIIIANQGKTVSGRVGLLIKNNTNISGYEKLKNWKCRSDKAMNQISCLFKGVLNPGQKTMLPLDFKKTVKGTITLFAENDSNLKNNSIYFSKKKIKRIKHTIGRVKDHSVKYSIKKVKK